MVLFFDLRIIFQNLHVCMSTFCVESGASHVFIQKLKSINYIMKSYKMRVGREAQTRTSFLQVLG